MVMANEGLVLQNLAVVKAQTAPLHRLFYLAQPEANSCFPAPVATTRFSHPRPKMKHQELHRKHKPLLRIRK